jgi:hypothetical protein
LPARLAVPQITANTLSPLLAPSLPPSVAVGEPVSLPPNFSVETPDGQRLFLGAVGAVRIDPLFTRTTKPGLYRIYDDTNTVVAGFAVHAGSPVESNLGQRQWQPDTLSAVESAVVPIPEPEKHYEDFWPLLAAFALAVILVEGWLAWRK